MDFVLVYNAPLSASGNGSKKRQEVISIRHEFNNQLKLLWETSRALGILQETGFIKNHSHNWWTNTIHPSPTLRQIYQRIPEAVIPLFGGITIGESRFQPLVRKSLALNCKLDILFLRQEDPGALITQAGDLDNRIKTLLDALRMPTTQELERDKPKDKHTFCLMESDTLVDSLDISTGRLLFPRTKYPNEVHLVIKVKLKLLHVSPETICLL